MSNLGLDDGHEAVLLADGNGRASGRSHRWRPGEGVAPMNLDVEDGHLA
jgi:hypothetical protein